MSDLSKRNKPNVGAVRAPRLPGTKAPVLKPNRKKLQFVKPAPNPLADVEEQATNEQSIAAEVDAVRIGIVERMKVDAARRKKAVATDDYFIIAFEDGIQANKFLEALGYPYLNDRFVDGLILAEIMGIELPKGETIAPLKTIHPKSLTKLVTKKWKRMPNLG